MMTKAGKRSYSLVEICKLSGVKPRTITSWSAQGLFRPPEFRASNTRYEESHLAQLRAIVRLRESGLRLDGVRERLAQDKVEAEAAAAKAEREAEEARLAAQVQAQAPKARAAPSTSLPTERWERVVLVPGVELHVNLALGPLVRPLVDDIRDHALARIAALTPNGAG